MYLLSFQPWTIQSDVVFLDQIFVVDSLYRVHTTGGCQPPVCKIIKLILQPLGIPPWSWEWGSLTF